ncbi:calmodulin-regulated spectrin-associated protein 3 isoform X2 [Pygocentrus nattereri]|uniref:calmodulin-regulated spectrin-associated protein 3 isoform X2 n=1 Tax=Pygocentrus nattereri TaxID=42514 RepID=UPI00189149B1|nr:calmodulin-regulated spectrin-associated protein 3 isoform X2 [Pygocentrus nattereri]
MVDSSAMRKTFVVPDIKPLDQYDFSRARICCSVGWLLAKSYGNAENVPVELRDPFYCDQYEQEHLKPPVTRLLLSPDLYCRTYSLLLAGGSGTEAPPRDYAALLQSLSKKGLAPKDQNIPVTEADLSHKPIKMTAHLALIDVLMAVGAMETLSTVRASGGADLIKGEADWESALLHWVNTLNQKLKERTENDQTQPSTEPQPVQPSCPTRWYWKLVPLRYRKDKMLSKLKPCFPVVKEVTDLSNGCAIAAVIHYYCPDLLHLEDVCMKDSMSLADSLYNLQLIREFSDSCLKSCCHLVLEDMLYSPPELQVNILSFLAELLYWFEVSKPEFVQPLQAPELTEPCGRTDGGNSGTSNSSPSIFKKPFLPISSPVTPAPGSLTQSTSMSHVEAAGQTWTKKPPSRSLSSAVSFSIPFGLDSDVDIVMGNPVITRSVSSDNLNPLGQPMTRVPYTPPEDLTHLLSKPSGPNGPHRASWATQSPKVPLLAEENGLDEGETGELPTIEEALQIIHNEGKMEPRLHPDGAPDGFYLHSPDDPSNRRHNGGPATLSCSAPSNSGMQHRPSGVTREPGRTRHTSEGSRDDDSVLRDGSVDSDASEELPKMHSTPAAPAGGARIVRPQGAETPDSGIKMTSFAERKKKVVPEQPTPSEEAAPQMTTWAAKKAEESPGKSPTLSNEMSELGARLEEKRKAIEAQKKRIEAIFAKHRQRLGKNAFLQLKKEESEEGGQGEIGTSSAELDERLARLESEERQDEEEEQKKQRSLLEDEGNASKQASIQQAPKEKPVAGTLGEKSTVPLGDYNNAVSKLNAALSSLQSDMQRLSEQQSQLMKKKGQPSNQAWVIPPSTKTSTPAPPRISRESTREMPPTSASSSPSPSRRITAQAMPPKSPGSHRRAQSAPPKSPKHHQPHSRSSDLKTPTLTRVITAPQSVDSIPHRRRLSPWQYRDQTSSSFSIGSPASQSESRPASQLFRPEDDNHSEAGSSEDRTIFSLDLEGGSTGQPMTRKEYLSGGGSSGAPSECSFESDVQPPSISGKRGSLIEISLSSLRGLEGEDTDHGPDAISDSMSDLTDPEMRPGVGFFFKDEARPEDEMAQRRAALLEKQQKRAEELKRKRQEQEREREASRSGSVDELRTADRVDQPQTPCTPPPARTPPPEGTPQRRGDFTRQEYERRQQLKIMEDLDKVLRQKPTTVRGVKKQRPKTVFHDDSALSRSPAKGFMGSKLNRVYSHSTNNLSSMANDGTLTVRKSPSRSHSPSRLMSPGRQAMHNGERDWEVASTISSPASIPEYTGPKLYKEPSFKSNKFIIHNAISRCCLAGKVNEPQKNKIIEEMEKSTANHFLILFRDTSCQFRAVYTMNPETEELVRLTGIGPRIISPSVIESIYKYSSDRKQFTAIPSKTMSMSVDAFTIPGHLWQSKRPGTPKKLGTPK